MKTIPQLRVRTEYSYRKAYGPVKEVAQRLFDLGVNHAGCVDTAGTWGHVQFDKACREAGVNPMFGAEFSVPDEETGAKPRFWALAAELPNFYRFSSANPQTEGEVIDWRADDAASPVVFAGAALSDPEAFDFIDLNPSSRAQQRAAMALHKRTGMPLVLTSDNDYPGPEHRLKFLAWDDSRRMTPQHVLSQDEFQNAFSFLSKTEFKQAVKNTQQAAEMCTGLQLRQAPIISVNGDIRAAVELGRRSRLERGHIAQWTEEYQARINRELDLIEEKQYQSYFLVVAEMVGWAKERMLVGPARGSSAGSLVCYLMGITEVDPLVHGLIFERFIDVNRDDLPDIDIDFNDQKRHLVFEHLEEKYGAENVARIGSVSKLRGKSCVAHVGKRLGIPHGASFGMTNVLIDYAEGDSRYGHSIEDTLTETQAGRDFLSRYPEAKLMTELENHASHSGQHAAGTIVSKEPIIEFCTVRDGIAQVDKEDAEALNLLKIDVLGLRTLGIIEDTGCCDANELYSLDYNDAEVLDVFNSGKFSGLFQFEGMAMRRVTGEVEIRNFKDIDHVTALARPGPLGSGAADTYIKRAGGREAVEYQHESMSDYLSETHGVVLYQEQLMKIVREVGQFSWNDTSTIRKLVSKSKGRESLEAYSERFIDGAHSLGIHKESALTIWEELCAFGRYGMNKSHTVSYAMISYWCAHMKHHHPLDYAAACLRQAKDDEQTVEILRELAAEGVSHTPFDAELSELNWVVRDGKLLGGFTNLVGVGAKTGAGYVERRNTTGLTEKDRAKLATFPVKHQDLRPAHTLWGHIYDDPDSANVHGPVKEFAELEDKEDAVVIVKLVRQERRDQNEPMLIAKRGYSIKGQTLQLDAFVVDDSVSEPVRVRLGPKMWWAYGEKIADRAVGGQDWFLIRGRWLAQFSMMSVTRIRCLTNEELFD